MNGRILYLLKSAFWLMALIMLAGCTSSSPRIPASYHLSFLAHPQLSQSAPLKISVLQLASDIDFLTTDFWSLQRQTQQALGGDVLHIGQLWLRAGQLNQNLSGDITAGARYIGIIAQYPAPDGKVWRLSLPLASEQRSFAIWPGSPEALRAEIVVDINGMRALR